MSGQPYSDKVAERAAEVLYEGPDQYGRPSSVTWTEMLTYGGEFPENTTHPIAENFRTMARGVLDAAHDREALGLHASVCAQAVWQWLADEYDDTVAEHFAEWVRS